MILHLLNYQENDSQGNYWNLKDLSLGKINLIVGRNATGKTRILNVLGGLASFVSGERKLTNGSFEVEFDGEKSIKYTLRIKNLKVEEEKLLLDNEVLLERGNGGEGKIYAEELKKNMKFQVPDNVLACVARRDSIQHPYFEHLYNWGNSTRLYYFGTQLGKDHIAIFTDQKQDNEINPKDTNRVVVFLKHGIQERGEQFSHLLVEDINNIGYEISEIGVEPIERIRIEVNSQQPEGLYIKEKDHLHKVDQTEISQGLFRALSLFIQLRYSECFSTPGLVLIDDIGEGLDYERATKLIKSLIRIAENSNIQLVMSTNDRFVMNNVPLEYWCVLHREGGECISFNYRNSKDLFDEFELTGLSNFDFFSSRYYEKDHAYGKN
jgi:energy-coupling factor transporter ATP-binding protein EcfA2